MRATLMLWRRILMLVSLLAFFSVSENGFGQVTHYQLLDGSTFLDDCAICDRVSIVYPVRGEFGLVLLNQSPLFSHYAVTNMHFVAGNAEVRGEGDFQVGGEVALLQQWSLKLGIASLGATNSIVVTNNVRTIDRSLPNVSVSCVQSNGTVSSTVYLNLKAAPLEEIWFLAHKPVGSLQPGDILSTRGRLVKSQPELLAAIGITNPPPGLTLDALDIRAGYRFSLSTEVLNSAAGLIRDGDFINGTQKEISVEQWTSAFGIPQDGTDPGLDAVHFLDFGDAGPVDFLFSIRQPVFSPKLNRTLGRGDLLAISYGSLPDEGSVRRTNAELLSRFHPPDRTHDYGLDGVYVWRHGEIWFSVEEGFLDAQLGAISEGDLLSDSGFIVFRNADLVRSFSGSESMDVGLSDFFVVTDAGYPTPLSVLDYPPVIDAVHGDVTLSWHTMIASGTVFQVERAPWIGAGFEPVSPIIAEMHWTDPGVIKSNRSAIYRIRGWK